MPNKTYTVALLTFAGVSMLLYRDALLAASSSKGRLSVVVAVFVTASTSDTIKQAFRASVAAYHQTPDAQMDVQLIFFQGNGSKISQSDVIVGNFVENMNNGKTFQWIKFAASNFGNATYIVKCDTDVSINWGKLSKVLHDVHNKARLEGRTLVYIGHQYGHVECGGFPHCPPQGCKHMDVRSGPCWIYASGGFYGFSQTLAQDIAKCDWAVQHSSGIEDLTSGRMVHHCAQQCVHAANISNGQAWCHSKGNTDKHIATGHLPKVCSFWV